MNLIAVQPEAAHGVAEHGSGNGGRNATRDMPEYPTWDWNDPLAHRLSGVNSL